MKRFLIISTLTLCLSALPAFGQRGGGMHQGGMHGPGPSMGGPGFGYGGMHGSWGPMSQGGGARIGHTGAAPIAQQGPSTMNNVQTPAAGTRGRGPWRFFGKILGFGRRVPTGAPTKGTVDVPTAPRQNAPHNGPSTR